MRRPRGGIFAPLGFVGFGARFRWLTRAKRPHGFGNQAEAILHNLAALRDGGAEGEIAGLELLSAVKKGLQVVGVGSMISVCEGNDGGRV